MKKLFKKVAGFAALALAALVPSMSANAATIYLDASAAGWTTANLHYWGNGTGDKPGEQVAGKSNFFKFTDVPDKQNGSFMFQTKTGEGGNDNASKDASQVNVTFADGHVYKLTAQEGRWKFQDNIFYLYCKLADYSNWDFDNPKATFAFNPDNGYYEAKVTTKAGNNGNYFFISTLNTGHDRSWDSHNNNRYTTGDGDKNPIDDWQTAKIADSGSYLVNGAFTDLLFQFDLDNGKVRAITEVTPPTPTNIKVICNNTAKWYNVKISYWGDGQSAKTYGMTNSSGDLWEYTIRETWTPTGFKFTDGNDKEYAYDEAPVDNTTYTNGNYVAPPTPGEISWYLQGANPMTWENVEDRQLKYNESTNCYELTYTIPASTEFKFVLNSNNNNTYYRTKGNGVDNKNDEVELGADEQLYVVGNNMYTLTEMKDVKIQIYKSDSNWKVRFGASPTTDIKVICNNTAKWSTVKLTYTGDATKTVDMTHTSGDLWEYTISETWTPTGFTFSDGNGNEYKYNQAPENNTTYTNGDPTPGEISWYLDDTKFTKVSDGEFTLTKNMGTSDFHIYKEEGSSKQGYNYNSNTQYGWNINDGDDEQLFENGNAMKMINGGIYLYTIYRDGSNWNMKVVSTIAVPDNLDLNYKYDNNWQTVGMTKDGSKFTCTLTGVKKSKDYFFHFNSESNCYQSTSDQNDAHYTNGDGRKLDFKIQNGQGQYDFKYYYDDSECDLKIEIDFSTMKVTVLRSNQPDNQYYLLGDVNNWMNDGTYTNGKEYGYGYSKAENGVRADYQFDGPKTINGSNNWYVLDLRKTKTGGNLWGQFTIVQDKGVFQPAKLEENRNDGRDVINWNGTWEQWSNAYDRTDKNNYLKETVKAYTDVPSNPAASAGVAEKDKHSNFHLDHNLYKGVKIYFNPTEQKIFMTYEDTQDFYIYLSTTADRADENGVRKVNVIKESMNNENYTLDFSSVRVVKSDGSLESDTNNEMEHVVLSKGEGDELPNGLKFTNYWKIKIPNGLEGPSGQKFVVSIDGAQDEGAQAFTSIFLNNLYFIDGVRVFATLSADVEVAAVSYRIYGLPADGDPENLQIFPADGTPKAVKEDPNDEFGWVDLQWGKFGYHPTSTSWWPEETVPAGYTQKTGFYPSFKDEAKTVYYEVPASHASKCIQWKITYGQRPSAANGMKKTRTGVQLNPATADLTVDRSDLNADWVLNGRHKELVIGVATGVEDIEVEDAEISEEGEAVAPVYYNLQGVRVAEPQHGLYIKVTGNKSEKILVK